MRPLYHLKTCKTHKTLEKQNSEARRMEVEMVMMSWTRTDGRNMKGGGGEIMEALIKLAERDFYVEQFGCEK